MQSARIQMKCGRATIEAAIDEARENGGGPYGVLFDIVAEHGTGEVGKGVQRWIDENGQPTFEKLLSFFAGYDDGAKAVVHLLAHQPSVHAIRPNDHYGVILLEHRQTGESFIVPYTTADMDKSKALVGRIKDQKDPRTGAWTERIQCFIHV